MLQLHNQTPFVAELSLLNNEHGDETAYAIVKATFQWHERWALADEQLPIWAADIYYDEPDNSSLRYPGEFHLGKLGTDILVEGDACAPEGKAVRQLPVDIQVGELRRRLQVFGDRVWINGRISTPEPFSTMPVVYERAYGGTLERGGEVLLCEERNPVGCFIASQQGDESLDGEPLPNIEDPTALIRAAGDKPTPAGLAPVPPHWSTRSCYAGTYDEAWREQRAPFAPEDFSRRFFNAAPAGLVCPEWLQGGEPIRVRGMHPAGDWQCDLPAVDLSIKARMQGVEQTLQPFLETVLLRPNQHQLVATWRAECVCPKRVLGLEAITIKLRR